MATSLGSMSMTDVTLRAKEAVERVTASCGSAAASATVGQRKFESLQRHENCSTVRVSAVELEHQEATQNRAEKNSLAQTGTHYNDRTPNPVQPFSHAARYKSDRMEAFWNSRGRSLASTGCLRTNCVFDGCD